MGVVQYEWCSIVSCHLQSYVTEIPPGNFLYSVMNINPCDEHTVVYNYYQYPGIATQEDKVLNELFLVLHAVQLLYIFISVLCFTLDLLSYVSCDILWLEYS